jgi:arylsulfatase A
MDHAFGMLMRSLDEAKLTESTFVFFTSDNGPEGDGVRSPGRGSTGGLRGRKRDLHEGGIREPGLARWPGHIQPGTTSNVPVIGSDMLPTMLALAGVAAPKDRILDGVNVLSVLTGVADKVERPQPLYWKLLMAPNAKVAMRVDDWKILANVELTEFELYNLASDERETTDLKDADPQRFAAMREQLLRHNAAVDAEGPDWPQRLQASGGRPKGEPPAKRAR